MVCNTLVLLENIEIYACLAHTRYCEFRLDLETHVVHIHVFEDHVLIVVL